MDLDMVHRPYTSMVSRATSSSVLVTLVGLCLSPTPSDTIGSVPLSHSEWLLKVFTDSYTGELESSRVVVQGETRSGSSGAWLHRRNTYVVG